MKTADTLVTGASGMLGSSIVRELLLQGYTPRCLVQPGVDPFTLKELDVEIVYGDLLDTKTLETCLQGCSYVIHAAAMTSVWPYRDLRVCRTNYQGVMNLAAAAGSAGVKRFVHIGSASSFAYGGHENPGTEEKRFNGWKFGLDYLNSKYLSQEYLLALYKHNGFPAVVINPTFMIGPYDSGPSSGRLLLALRNGKLPGYTTGGKNFVYSGDVARAAVCALTKGKAGECYIAGGENLSYREFFEIACMVMGISFRLKPLPATLIRAYALANSLIAQLRGKAPMLSYTAAKLSMETQFYSSAKLWKTMNIVPTPIQFAIQHSMQWFLNNGYVKTRELTSETFQRNQLKLSPTAPKF